MGRAADPGVGRALDGPARGARRRDRCAVPGRLDRPDRARRLHDRAALQADARRRRAATGAHRDRARPRQLPHRPVRRRRRGPRVRAEPAVDRRGHHRRGHPRAAGRGGGGADRAGRAQPRRLPLGLARRRRRAHRDRPRRGCAGALGPLALGRLGAGRPRRLGRRPGGGLHLQVPQRRSGGAGVRLRRRAAARRPGAADPGLDGRDRHLPDGSDLPPGRRHPPHPVRHPAGGGDAGAAGHARPRREGRHGCDPGEVARAHDLRDRACGRAAPRDHARLARATPPGAVATSPSTTR